MAGDLGPGHAVRLLGPQEEWVQQLLTKRLDLTYQDAIRYCVAFAMELDDDCTVAAATAAQTRPGSGVAWQSRRKRCVGCGRKDETVRGCCQAPGARPVCDACHAAGKGNHHLHGRRTP